MKYNYDKQPFIQVPGFEKGHSFSGYEAIRTELAASLAEKGIGRKVLVIDFYPGVRKTEIEAGIVDILKPELVVYTDEAIFRDALEVSNCIKGQMTDDRVFGVMTHYQLADFIDVDKFTKLRQKIQSVNGLVVLYGVGASLLTKGDIHVFCDLARWEIQQRYRSGELSNWKDDSGEEDVLKKFKWGFFFEWRMADRHKRQQFANIDYIIDTNQSNQPKMITADSYFAGLLKASESPFRVVPFFDPGVWGGQWLKTVCDLNRNVENYAWSFDCVPEENSLLLKVGETIVETPAINLVFRHPQKLLGEKVYARFGAEFPIRFDFLDTMAGQNLSLQVHPLTSYIYDRFGMAYTQDESYYIMDAGAGAGVYLGVKTGVNEDEFITELKKAQTGDNTFAAEEYVNLIPAKKHDHFSIPAGTVHCSAKDTVVLEISATPYIFTFKLWDWNRLGLDGKPRPVHIEHGKEVIQYDRNTEWVMEHLVNPIEIIKNENGILEEKTGLHSTQFIETRRYWFKDETLHETGDGVNVLNLVEGEECIVESPTASFDPLIVHYAETFIIPASVGSYRIAPHGVSIGKEIAIIKAFVRT